MMFELLLQPFQFPFMQNAFFICVLVAVPTALLSCYLVLKGWALMGDAVSHAVLPGIVLAYILNIPLLIGAFVAGMICALATGYLSYHSRVKQDTIMGVVFSGMFGFGIVLYVWIETNAHLDHILFGNMLGVETGELWTSGVISALVSGGLIMKWRDLLLHSFDPIQAKSSGLRVNAIHYGLLAALSLTIVATLSAAGLLTRSFSMMLIMAVGINIVCMLLGTYLSFHLDSAPAPTIILVLTCVFLLAFAARMLRIRRTTRRSVGIG